MKPKMAAEEGHERPCVCGHDFTQHGVYYDGESGEWRGYVCGKCPTVMGYAKADGGCARFRPVPGKTQAGAA